MYDSILPVEDSNTRSRNAKTSVGASGQPKLPVYDSILPSEDSNDVMTKTDKDMNYDIIRDEFNDFNHEYDTVAEVPYDTVSLGEFVEQMEVGNKPSLAAYAITSVDTSWIKTKVPPNQSKAGKFKENLVINRVRSLQGSRPGGRRVRYGKKPVPRPKPKHIRSKAHQFQLAAPQLVKSASLSQMGNYSQINPKSSYAELEPHITPQEQEKVNKASNVDDRKPQKEEYSHLEHSYLYQQ